ncbi:MAG: class I SAM-dependent methyltransferase [Acidimicrobiales bacterium]
MTTTAGQAIEAEPQEVTRPALPDQTAKLLGHLGGYVAVRTVGMGLRNGLIEALAAATGNGSESPGLMATELATATNLDPFYVEVWCQAAVAVEVVERHGACFALAPHMATALLDEESPAYIAGAFLVFERPDVFDRFEERFATGRRVWWDECTAEFIDGVARTGRSFYTRLVPGGLERVPGLTARLQDGARILDLACGAGLGLARLARTYPSARLVGVDGDAHSLREAARRLSDEGLTDRVELVQAAVEDITWTDEFDAVISNISMHECRDIEKATASVYQALRPRGTFVISDFPFPDSIEGLRTRAGRAMAGVQFFEAQIDDQLLPVSTYLELLPRHGFQAVTSFAITPMHAVTHGTK